MMNPDQLYIVRQLQHQDLQAETEQARLSRELAGERTAWGRTWLATWLQRLGVRRTRDTTPPEVTV
jgi:hypothetical protein